MEDFLQILALTTICMILFWFGYTLFFGRLSPFYSGGFFGKNWKKQAVKGEPGDPQICPLCCIKMDRGDLVKSLAFPSITGGQDRLMFIKGCFSCLEHDVPRKCPVCGAGLSINDYLVSRMFERPGNRSHVHVFGCNLCKNMGTLTR